VSTREALAGAVRKVNASLRTLPADRQGLDLSPAWEELLLELGAAGPDEAKALEAIERYEARALEEIEVVAELVGT
jgi:hypothetical protein